MKQTLFLGVAAVLDAVGAFFASDKHLYTAYAFFSLAIVMAGLAIWVAFRNDYCLRQGKKELSRVLFELSECERDAYNGKDGLQYDELKQRITKARNDVEKIGKKYLDESILYRFLAVNVLDTQLDEATKLHFMARAQASFWTLYQQIRGWRISLERILQELPYPR